MKKQFAFLLVWICSGVTMCAYQTNNKILGLGFTLLSFMYFFILEERDNKLKERKKYIKARKNNKICNITDEELMNFIVRGRKLYHEASNNEKDCAKKNACLVFTHMFIWEIKTAFVAPAKPAVTILCRSGRINDEDLAKILKLRSKPYINRKA